MLQVSLLLFCIVFVCLVVLFDQLVNLHIGVFIVAHMCMQLCLLMAVCMVRLHVIPGVALLISARSFAGQVGYREEGQRPDTGHGSAPDEDESAR